ncbi:MAG: hypothetical protein OEZ58_13865 [Gammaproteobacteria bacterium]|nr:hypothetical protein [Gammaproteobacteria bacterium]MDH5730076.1 hypothetical protein [Gammaproteobacteria bacterium]
MTRLFIAPTSTAQWHKLVNDAQVHCKYELEEDLESYLVFLLMRFLSRPEMVNSILAIEYLQSFTSQGQLRQIRLQEVGDHCLLFSGLFPKQAQRRRVKISYFVNLGRSAYHQLAENSLQATAELYSQLALHFVPVMDVLHAIRRLGADSPVLEPMEAMELWSDTGSKQALENLRESTQSSNIQPLDNKTPRH